MVRVKKALLISAASILMLYGCDADKSAEENRVSNGSTITEEGSKSMNEETQSKDDELAVAGSLSPEEVIQETEKQLNTNIPIKLPKTLKVTNNKHLTAKTSSDKDQYTVMFIETDEPRPINNEAVKDEEANVATLKATKFETAEKASEQINYEDHAAVGGKEVDLGHGIKGYSEGAAGSLYIGWNEGRWSIAVRGFTEQGAEVEEKAKEVVEYLEKNMLPAPHDIGAAMLDVTNNNKESLQRISWQEDDVVYEIETSRNDIAALEIAVSIQENQK